MKSFVLFCFITIWGIPCAQSQVGCQAYRVQFKLEKSIGLVGGWQQGKTSFPEIGIGFGYLESSRHGPFFQAISTSLEFNPWNDVYGIKATGWKNIPFIPVSIGAAVVSYHQQGIYDFTFRPMLGVGWRYFQLTYGFDIPIFHRNIAQRNNHQVSLRYFLPVFKWEPKPKIPHVN